MDKVLTTLKLNNGRYMPTVGIGTFFGQKGTFSEDDVVSSIESAIACGYRHIDTAWIYHNEQCVGKAVHNSIRNGLVTRDELFITSKLSFQHHELSCIRDVVQESMSDLGVTYLDLYLIHSPFAIHKLAKRGDPVPDPAPLNQANDLIAIWKESLVDEGLVKSIGVSNFNSKQIQNILDNCRIKPVTNQCEIHLYFQNEKLREFCVSRRVHMTAYTPLGQPVKSVKANWKSPLQEQTLKDIAMKHNKSAAQVALKYQLQRGIVVIPRSSNPNRIKENIQLFDFTLSDGDMSALQALDKGLRAFTYDKFKEHKDYPLNEEF